MVPEAKRGLHTLVGASKTLLQLSVSIEGLQIFYLGKAMKKKLVQNVDPINRMRSLVRSLIHDHQHTSLVDRTEIAELTRLGTATIDRLVKAGEIPSILIGRCRRFIAADVIEALKVNSKNKGQI